MGNREKVCRGRHNMDDGSAHVTEAAHDATRASGAPFAANKQEWLRQGRVAREGLHIEGGLPNLAERLLGALQLKLLLPRRQQREGAIASPLVVEARGQRIRGAEGRV